MISAKIIADSIDYRKNRITTFVLVFPRIILAEFNTHRAISRNSASSRAIPFKRMVEMVKENPFIPIKWMKDHSGMQGTEYLNEMESDLAKMEWLHMRDQAVKSATILNRELLVTKQICNRPLEQFMYHTVIATGTNWENFFALRANPQAEIHMQDLAFKMLDAYNQSTPDYKERGEWHIPFGDKMDREWLHDYGITEMDNQYDIDDLMVKVATARCARVSYMTFDGKIDHKKDIELHDNLVNSGHWSPFEHCAKVSYWNMDSGNFRGWTQYRKMFVHEDKSDDRVTKR